MHQTQSLDLAINIPCKDRLSICKDMPPKALHINSAASNDSARGVKRQEEFPMGSRPNNSAGRQVPRGLDPLGPALGESHCNVTGGRAWWMEVGRRTRRFGQQAGRRVAAEGTRSKARHERHPKIRKFRTDKFYSVTNGNFDSRNSCKRLFDFFCSCIRGQWTPRMPQRREQTSGGTRSTSAAGAGVVTTVVSRGCDLTWTRPGPPLRTRTPPQTAGFNESVIQQAGANRDHC